MKKIISLIFMGILFFNSLLVIGLPVKNSNNIENVTFYVEDFDPLVDINVTIDILAIRALDGIDNGSDPDFFVKLFINDEEFTSPVWENSKYLYDCWTVTKNVPDNVSKVDITIQLWDFNSDENQICDINGDKNQYDEGLDLNLAYDISNGRWSGDDYYVGDGSGYGRGCGSGDGSYYTDENDCELWFNIYQNDYDNDGLPYWVETNIYETDPEESNIGEDEDSDGVPIEWEHRFGFNPFIWEDHVSFDPDDDSLTNIEEFLTFDFGSDPYRRDVFLEMDFMVEGPDGKNNTIENEAYELLRNPYHRRNIVFHIDSGELYGGDWIPFDDNVDSNEKIVIYDNYFIKSESEAWRRSVYHYGIIVNFCRPAGYAFRGDGSSHMGYGPGTNSFIFCRDLIDVFEKKKFFYFKSTDRDFLYASNIMHEMGHNFGLRYGNPPGVDMRFGQMPWQINFWRYGRYKSIMNYRYTYDILDYSDGSHGRRDFDDWEHIDLSYFEKPKNGTLISR